MMATHYDALAGFVSAVSNESGAAIQPPRIARRGGAPTRWRGILI
jgi:hypothetical protein